MAAPTSQSWHQMLEWTYSGVDHSLPGNGGEECINFIPSKQKMMETAMFVTLGMMEILIGLKTVRLDTGAYKTRNMDPLGKRVLLLIMTLTFGIELGFKFSTRQMIWILNPCHIVTMMQIFLLAAPPSKVATIVFRLHIHGLSGAIIAILFPVVNTRLVSILHLLPALNVCLYATLCLNSILQLPFETEVYYIQHIMILVIPYYLMRQGGAYTPEPITNYSWCFLMLGMLFVYHWAMLQGLAIISLVNLNNMVCPAVSDPFHGRWYRVCAVIHQTAAILVLGKVYTLLCKLLIPAQSANTVQEDSVTKNGHCKTP